MGRNKITRALNGSQKAAATLRRWKLQGGFTTPAVGRFPYPARTCAEVRSPTRNWPPAWGKDGFWSGDMSHEAKAEQRRRERYQGIHPCSGIIHAER